MSLLFCVSSAVLLKLAAVVSGWRPEKSPGGIRLMFVVYFLEL